MRDCDQPSRIATGGPGRRPFSTSTTSSRPGKIARAAVRISFADQPRMVAAVPVAASVGDGGMSLSALAVAVDCAASAAACAVAAASRAAGVRVMGCAPRGLIGGS